jgi:hypothetical protein
MAIFGMVALNLMFATFTLTKGDNDLGCPESFIGMVEHAKDRFFEVLTING